LSRGDPGHEKESDQYLRMHAESP